MIKNQGMACSKTGFVAAHAPACEGVAERMNCIILFREPGKPAQGLIADNYAMKGFRIDTKSCNWGPMRGFVCADPRLSKPKDAKTSFCVRNVDWTEEAIAGHINHKWFGNPAGEHVDSWRADVMPIVLSRARIDELVASGAIEQPTPDRGCLTGVSTQTFGDATGTVRLPWRLVPADGKNKPWLRDEKGSLPLAGNYFILCVDRLSTTPFLQRYLSGVMPIRVSHGGQLYDTILGLINPGTKHRGFKACVTADYDLFATWPSTSDMMGKQHSVVGQLAQLGASDRANLKPSDIKKMGGRPSGAAAAMPTDVARMGGVDDRLKSAGHSEHYRYGDVSARVLTLKVMLNTAIQKSGYLGGNAIHHNDEAGNFMLAKDNLMECLPVLAFTPPLGLPSQTLCIENLEDFKELGLLAREKGYTIIAKDAWKKSAGLA